MENPMVKLELVANGVELSIQSNRLLKDSEFAGLQSIVRVPAMSHDQPVKSAVVSSGKSSSVVQSSNKPKTKLRQMGYSDYGMPVNAHLICPKCSHTETKKVSWGYHYTYCPVCGERLFLRYGGSEKGIPDELGNYYVADTAYRMSGSDDNTNDDYPEPDEFDTVDVIKKYLDHKGIDYSDSRFKWQLVNLLPSKSKESQEK